jgi:hypothetical protein
MAPAGSMTKRHLQLAVPRAGDIALNMVRGMPKSTMLVTAGAWLAGGYVLKRSYKQRHV